MFKKHPIKLGTVIILITMLLACNLGQVAENESSNPTHPSPTREPEKTEMPSPTKEPTLEATTEETIEPSSKSEEAQSVPTVTCGEIEESSTVYRLLEPVLPERDQRLLAMRLKNHEQDIPEMIRTEPLEREIGDTETFWVSDNFQTPPRQFESTARLEYITDHSYWWVEEGMEISETGLQHSAEQFEEETYPNNRAFFGSEWSPGIDGDEHVHIFMGNVPGVAGYFSASNSYSQEAIPYSNEREMFFINLNAIVPGTDYFDSVLAHEFQHMIHWHQDRSEDTWLNEGASELASFLNGYGISNFTGTYFFAPDTQLNTWSSDPGGNGPHYGGSFLFMAYFLQRYGDEMTQALVAHPQNGIAGFNTILEEHNYSEQFNDIFADFLVANYLNDFTIEDGQWGYRENLGISPPALAEHYRVYPAESETTVQQYGADYIELSSGEVEKETITIEFSGDTEVKVLDNQAHSGTYQWYSHRGDDTNTRLTQTFDLSGVDQATLQYWVWYDIEEDWDYGYVEVSTDGEHWTILQAPHSATTNPSGNAYGPGYTGSSSGWIEESIDLSEYAGQEIQIRFEYVTDDAVNRSGWAVDDIQIPEIDFFDDGENGTNGWQAEGFVLIENRLDQCFLVQVVETGKEKPIIHRMTLDGNNQGSLTLTLEELEKAVLIISGLTPITTESAHYEYRLLSQ